ncbi:hypothetical protein KCP76_21250 [Salmonella enterica subsp. enterica serovar Weltevreden]|nr:hypothetical protein KCP76_21250 [Salmonella enterica subsp. enterica serovar Weltevreden]
MAYVASARDANVQYIDCRRGIWRQLTLARYNSGISDRSCKIAAIAAQVARSRR